MDREKMQAELVQKLQDMGKQEAHDAKVYAQGVQDGIAKAAECVRSANLSGIQPGSADAVNEFIFELCKELDVHAQDIRVNPALCLDEKAAILANRIREAFGALKE